MSDVGEGGSAFHQAARRLWSHLLSLDSDEAAIEVLAVQLCVLDEVRVRYARAVGVISDIERSRGEASAVLDDFAKWTLR